MDRSKEQILPGRSWGRFTEERAFELNLQESSKCKREKVSASPAESQQEAQGTWVFGGRAVPYVQGKADRAAEVVRGQASWASVLVRTLGLQETKDTFPRGSNGQEIY